MFLAEFPGFLEQREFHDPTHSFARGGGAIGAVAIPRRQRAVHFPRIRRDAAAAARSSFAARKSQSGPRQNEQGETAPRAKGIK